MTRRRVLMTIIGILFSAVFLWIASRNTSLSAVKSAFHQLEYWRIIPLTASFLAFYWIRTIRWKILLGPIAKVRTAELFGPVMIGYAANFVVPFQLGEVARSFAASKKTGLPVLSLGFSIVIERLFDFLVILLLLAVALSFLSGVPASVARFGVATAIVVCTIAGLALWVTLKTDLVLSWADRLIRFLPDRIRSSILEQLRLGAEGLRSLRHSDVLIAAAATSMLQWLMIAFCIRLSLQAVNVDVPWETLLLIVSFIVLGGTVPNAPGYVGSIQAGYTVALELTGFDPAKGIAASIIYHLIYAATALGLGLVSIRRARLDLKAVASASRGKLD